MSATVRYVPDITSQVDMKLAQLMAEGDKILADVNASATKKLSSLITEGARVQNLDVSIGSQDFYFETGGIDENDLVFSMSPRDFPAGLASTEGTFFVTANIARDENCLVENGSIEVPIDKSIIAGFQNSLIDTILPYLGNLVDEETGFQETDVKVATR
jgi:hypothetical protein